MLKLYSRTFYTLSTNINIKFPRVVSPSFTAKRLPCLQFSHMENYRTKLEKRRGGFLFRMLLVFWDWVVSLPSRTVEEPTLKWEETIWDASVLTECTKPDEFRPQLQTRNTCMHAATLRLYLPNIDSCIRIWPKLNCHAHGNTIFYH